MKKQAAPLLDAGVSALIEDLEDRGLLKETLGSDRERIIHAYELLYARPPRPEEIAIGLDYLNSARLTGPRQASQPAMPNSDLKAWEEYAQVLLCANEFIYVD